MPYACEESYGSFTMQLEKLNPPRLTFYGIFRLPMDIKGASGTDGHASV